MNAIISRSRLSILVAVSVLALGSGCATATGLAGATPVGEVARLTADRDRDESRVDAAVGKGSSATREVEGGQRCIECWASAVER